MILGRFGILGIGRIFLLRGVRLVGRVVRRLLAVLGLVLLSLPAAFFFLAPCFTRIRGVRILALLSRLVLGRAKLAAATVSGRDHSNELFELRGNRAAA